MKEALETKTQKTALVKKAKYIDLSGCRFGKYLVLNFSHRDKHYAPMWLCLCDCGNQRTVTSSNLRFGGAKSCGCASVRNLVGEKFHKLTVLKFSHKDKNSHPHWICLCECGIEKTISGPAIVSGHTKSCGCLPRDQNVKHGHTARKLVTKEYSTWVGLKDRTCNPSGINYPDYGGRGIKCCDRWLHSFDNFYLDMGDRPNGMTIDRINVDGDYEPSNCRWATPKDQARNRRSARRIEFNGKIKSLVEWSEETGVKPTTITGRIKLGWPLEEALFKPIKTI